MGEPAIIVNLVLDNKTIAVPYNSTTTAENVCIYVCKQLNIGTLTRHLFALRVTGKSVFLTPAATFGAKGATVDFRIRFKVADISKLEKIDINAYNYYFHQARNDVLDNKIPDIVYEKYRRELVGLGITDMYRVMLEKDIGRETVENDYKKYIPKEVLKRHSFFIRKPIHDTLRILQKSEHNASYVRAEYLKQLKIIAPEYLSEIYKAIIHQNGADYSVIIKLSPSHPSELTFRYCTESKKEQWQLICTVEELGFISMKNDTIEISRKNGIPFYIRFVSVPAMYSFISLLDGYYRLTCKWTFNICREVYTPSLQKLYAMRCHGPVGGEFSYAKLEAKRGNRAGCFIIRESESKYNNYYIDVCMKEGLKPKTFKLEKIMGDEFIFNDDLTRYKSIHQLMAAYSDPNGAIYLQECLPPSEYDVSPLLLCKNETLVGDSLTDSSALNVLMPTSPMCINCKNLQVYKGTYCYAISLQPEKQIEKKYCYLRKCKSEQCSMAGTGNDYIGVLNTTRSNRTCNKWDYERTDVHAVHMKKWNDTLFADMSSAAANNFCRNPSRDVSGSWCYTTDPKIIEDACNVRDCDKPEECIIIIGTFLMDRRVFILPQWKEAGLHGGLRFAIKEWNPDLLDGLDILITSKFGSDVIRLQIGANYNERIVLKYNNRIMVEKTLPHIIAAGKWTELWLQIRQGEIMLGFEGVPTSLFEWKSSNPEKEFEPMFMSYGSILGYPLGLFFNCDECHTENTTVHDFRRYQPIGLWSKEERPIYKNLTIRIRGTGVVLLSFTWVPGNGKSYLVEMDNNKGIIVFSRVDKGGSLQLMSSNVNQMMTINSWTRYDILFTESTFEIQKENQTVLRYNSKTPIIIYWFVVAVKNGWVTWSANCEPLDLDGPPRDGGWSGWSPWTCTVSCGGGEGFRTRKCSNPRPNILGKLCQGSPTATGKCNEFPCGDVSPDTLEHVRDSLQKESLSYVVREGQKKEGSRGITVVFRSMWKITKGKKIEVAMKMLNQESSGHYLKDFLTLAGQWAFLQSSAIVRLYGIAFTSNISLVLEYFRLGPLDQYLQKNRGIVKTVDLVEAASNLASALWHLTENDIVHGNIRCRKLMVNTHDDNSFTVKLTDPGIHTSYGSSEVHWIPVECYSNLNYAKRSIEADVWAFATTLWEMFTFGEEIKSTDHGQTMRWYISGKRLPQPQNCPNEIYSLMKECWDIDPHKRKKPQALSRDINQILYQVYDSRQNHLYAKVTNKVVSKSNGLQNVAGASTNSLQSTSTESTMVTDADNLIGASEVGSDISGMSSFSGAGSQSWLMNSQDLVNYEDSDSYNWSVLFPHINLSTATTSLDSLNSMQSVFELDGNYNVVLQGRIGQGFYGEVYKGTLECVDGQDEEPRKVAVKKLKATALSSCLQDFEREINIMKSLNHPNIVEILGVLREPEISLVMEFVHHGSLQSYLKIYKESLQEEQLLKYALGIAKGMDYLGKKNIVHRDLAARNILVVDENHVKISDFGLAQVMGTNDYYILKTPNRELPIKWYAPESLRDGKFSVRSDVWSYGVTMCEMFNYGEEPNLANIDEEIEGQQQQVLLTALEKGARFPCPSNCPKNVYIRIIYPCWQADPHSRPLFAQLTLEVEDLLTQY